MASRRAHNPEVVGSNPASAISLKVHNLLCTFFRLTNQFNLDFFVFSLILIFIFYINILK